MLGPAGYAWFVERFQLACAPPYHMSEIAPGARTRLQDGYRRVYERFPPDYDPGDSPVEQLVFALKYDGVELGILARAFAVIEPSALRDAIAATPTGKYLRRLWFFYEWLTGQQLDLPDIQHNVGYVEALDPTDEYTAPPVNVMRQRVRNNLLGSRVWCPRVRRTSELARYGDIPWSERITAITRTYDADLMRRAVSWLYTKETRSSFELEGERVDDDRETRFVELLYRGPRSGKLDEPLLVELQNAVVQHTYRESSYRSDQNYVGSNALLQREKVHYVTPRPEDVPTMMSALIDLANKWTRSQQNNRSVLDPVVAAAVIAFGFVFIHPFDDGNGRIHRFLIHFVLHVLQFCPDELILPVSAAILRDKAGYDMVLEDVSRPILRHVRYQLDDRGRMTATGNDAVTYAYLDYTAHAEALYRWIEQAIEHDLVEEIDILRKVDDARRRMQRVVDMPDRKRELFIRLCLSNKFSLARSKRRLFAELSEDQVERLEHAIAVAFGDEPQGEAEEDD